MILFFSTQKIAGWDCKPTLTRRNLLPHIKLAYIQSLSNSTVLYLISLSVVPDVDCFALHLGGECKDFYQLGMEDGRIKDDQLTASSEWSHEYRTHFGRLNQPEQSGQSGHWASRDKDQNQWIQADLLLHQLVVGVILQGSDSHNQYVTKYKVAYSLDGVTWQNVQDIQGNDKVSLSSSYSFFTSDRFWFVIGISQSKSCIFSTRCEAFTASCKARALRCEICILNPVHFKP